jgi:hypothetical protein
MPEPQPPPADADPGFDKQKETRTRFLNREAAEVYLLLDFLSGRADRSLRATSDEQARSLLQDQLHASTKAAEDQLSPEGRRRQRAAEKDRREIERDLKDPTQLVLRTMQIKYPLAPTDENFETNAAFLMRARDVLNTRAAPATGATIAFTSMVSAHGSKADDERVGDVTAREFAESAYPWLKADARRLDLWIRHRLGVMVVVLTLAIGVSAYAAWGKVMLDTLDAVRRDDAATQQVLITRGSVVLASRSPTADGMVSSLNCDDHKFNVYESSNPCNRVKELKLRSNVTHNNIAFWLMRWSTPDLDQEDPMVTSRWIGVEQLATASLTVLGNYVMPIMYGFLGSLAYVLRRHYDRLTVHLLSPRDLRANAIRLRLGTMIGGCIGLVYSGSGAAQTTGTLGLAVTLSTSAIAFLAGYGVDGVFKALDGLITQVFRANAIEKPPQPSPPA